MDAFYDLVYYYVSVV